MTKQQGQLLVMAVGVAGVIGFILWRANTVAEQAREELARIDAEQQPPVIPRIPTTTPEDLLQSMERLLRGIAKATDSLEENHLKRREAVAKGMPFPDDLDASSRLLRTKSLEQLSGLDRLIDEHLERKWSEHTIDKMLSYKKQAAGLRDVLQRLDFEPVPKK